MKIPTLLKPKELSSIFGVKVKTIYAMLYRYEIPGAFQIGNNWYINQEVLLREIEKKSTTVKRQLGTSSDPKSDRHGIA